MLVGSFIFYNNVRCDEAENFLDIKLMVKTETKCSPVSVCISRSL